jgi:hypothetical protein
LHPEHDHPAPAGRPPRRRVPAGLIACTATILICLAITPLTMAASPGDIWLSNGDLAERFGVPLSTVRAWRLNGTGPQGVRIGRVVRYRLSEVRRWEREQERAERDRRAQEAS